MSSLLPEPNEGKDHETLESCKPIKWVGSAATDEAYCKSILARMRAVAHREPEFLSQYGMERHCVLRLLSDAKSVLAREHTLELVDVPPSGKLHILGDLHGDLFSFLSALNIAGLPSSENRLVIAGDLVDRGCWGIEILICVFVLKLWRPKYVYIIRGNHETTGCVSRYGFELEVRRKYDLRTYKSFMHTLRELPLAIIVRRRLPGTVSKSSLRSRDRHRSGITDSSVSGRGSKSRTQSRDGIDSRSSNSSRRTRADEEKVLPCDPDVFENGVVGTKRYLVCHGGLWRKHRAKAASTGMTVGSLRDLASEHRQVDDPEGSITEDILWSDPANPREKASFGVRSNDLRGAGIFYGEGAVDAFFKRENIHGLIRGHEGPDMRKLRPGMDSMCQGYSIDMETSSGFVVTVFSAADYPMDCGFGNRGCVATILGSAVETSASASLPQFTTFASTRPTPSALFYNSSTSNCPHTPR